MIRICLLAGSAASLFAAPGLTQHASPTVARPADKSSVDEIVVTARLAGDAPGSLSRRRVSGGPLGERDVLDTPLSVTGFTDQLIRDVQATVIADVAKNDPSLNFATTAGGALTASTIRGFSIGFDNSLYDGLPGVGRSTGVLPIELLDRVEIIKGPGSFLYSNVAFSGVGGVLNMVPKRALDADLTRTTISYLSQSQVEGQVDVSRRFGEGRQLGVRVNGAIRRGETGVNDNHESLTLGALALDWKPSNRLRLFVNVDAFRALYRGYTNGAILAPALTMVPKAPDASDLRSPTWASYEGKQFDAVARVEWDFADGWRLSANGLHTELARPRNFIPTAFTINNLNGNYTYNATYNGKAEKYFLNIGGLKLDGRFETGPVLHKVDIGASIAEFRYSSGVYPPGVAFAPLGSFQSNIYNPTDPPEPTTVPQLISGPTPRIDGKSRSGYIADTMSVLDERLFAIGGLRRTNIKYNTYNIVTRTRTQRFDETKNVPFFAVGAKPIGTILLYGSYTEGFERGGQAPIGTTNAGTNLPPLTSKQYEAGLKAEVAGIIATVSAFDINKGLELTQPNANGTSTYVQDGRQRHKGLEFTASGEPIVGVRLLGGLTLIDPKVSNTANPAHEGHRPPGVPRRAASLYAEYDVAGLKDVTLTGGIYNNSPVYFDLANRQRVPGWTRFDLGVRYGFSLGRSAAAVRLNVENVADRNYWGSAIVGQLYIANPRIIKASFGIDW